MGKPAKEERFMKAEADFHGAVVDEQGREIPITEAMIQHACKVLEHSWPSPWAQLRGDA